LTRILKEFMMDLSTSVGGVVLSNCVYNASGPRCGTKDALIKIGKSNAGAIVSKSATMLKQDGNTMPRFIKDIDLGSDMCSGSFNSEGLPNQGIDYYIADDVLTSLQPMNKPYFVSLSGHTIDDNCEMLRRVLHAAATHSEVSDSCIRGVELNLACPNVPGKPVIAYDFIQMYDVLRRICAVYDEMSISQVAAKTESKEEGNCRTIALGIKLAPYLDTSMAKAAVDILLGFKSYISYVVTCNAMGNALFVDTVHECCSIAGKSGLGGLGGGYCKQVSLANVRMLYTLLQENGAAGDIDVVGVGGIRTGEDAFQSILCGAAAVQIATCHWTEGSECFQRISHELSKIMEKKGYTSITQFRGHLKQYEKHESMVPRHPPTVTEHSPQNTMPISHVIIGILVGIIALLLGQMFNVKQVSLS
jgi:dihydroorotate dehydrogenase (fumarate)